MSIAVSWWLRIDIAGSDCSRGVTRCDINGEATGGIGNEVWLKPMQEVSPGGGGIDHECHIDTT